MFPTTVWTHIRRAGALDQDALERFADDYRQPVLGFVRARGFQENDAEDLCQDVFLRLIAGNVLARADSAKGRFRSLVLSVVTHVIQDRHRRRRETPVEEIEVVDRDPDFDRRWVIFLAERAMERLRRDGSRYYNVLYGHLAGNPQDRNRLWIARRKLVAMIRAEVASTCTSHTEFEEEVAYLSRFLDKKAEKMRHSGSSCDGEKGE